MTDPTPSERNIEVAETLRLMAVHGEATGQEAAARGSISRALARRYEEGRREERERCADIVMQYQFIIGTSMGKRIAAAIRGEP